MIFLDLLGWLYDDITVTLHAIKFYVTELLPGIKYGEFMRKDLDQKPMEMPNVAAQGLTKNFSADIGKDELWDHILCEQLLQLNAPAGSSQSRSS